MVIAIRVGDRDAGFPHPPPAFLTYDPALACPQLLVTDGEEYGRRWEKDEDGNGICRHDFEAVGDSTRGTARGWERPATSATTRDCQPTVDGLLLDAGLGGQRDEADGGARGEWRVVRGGKGLSEGECNRQAGTTTAAVARRASAASRVRSLVARE